MKKWPLLTVAAVILSFCVGGGILAKERENFFESSGRALVFSGFQIPKNFRNEIDVLNNKRYVFGQPSENDTFWDADVWVLFLDSPEQAKDLPSPLDSLFEKTAAGKDSAPFIFSRFDLAGGEEKSAAFVFLDRYNQDYDEAVCRAARSLFLSVLGELNSGTAKRAIANCRN